MNQRVSAIAILSLSFLVGCEPVRPTTFATLNLSGRELVGDFSVKHESAPFASDSLHTGGVSVSGGETVTVDVVDLWTEKSYRLEEVVPSQAPGETTDLLLMSITKDLSLSLTWKRDKQSLSETRSKYFAQELKCVPMVVYNKGPRSDFVTRLIQDTFVYRCDRSYIEPTDHFINYGFLHVDESLPECLVAISYGAGNFSETRLIKVPMHHVNSATKPLTVYLHVGQSDELATLYLLKDANPNPRIAAGEIESKQLVLPEPSLQIEISRTTKHVTRHRFCLPDLDSLRAAESEH